MAVAGDSSYSHGHADGHFVRFYEAQSSLVDEVAEFAERALRLGGHAIAIAKSESLAALAARLRGFGRADSAAAHHRGRLVMLDAELMLSHFMVNGWPDENRFLSSVGAVVAHAAQSGAAPFTRSAKWWDCFASAASTRRRCD